MVPNSRTRLKLALPGEHDPLDARDIEIPDGVIERIRSGEKLVLAPAGDERPDALPDLTGSLRVDRASEYLVQRPHRWRRQLCFKGRRLTVGPLLARMNAEGWTAEETANQFELPIAAVDAAVEYGAQFAALIQAEHARDAGAAVAPRRAATA